MGSDTESQGSSVGGSDARVIKRYSNRKLYDTNDSRYVTLQQIGEMVRRGEHVRIIDNKTKEDKTEVTLALILSEDLRSKPKSVPLGTLRTLIQERGEKLLSQLREGPIGRLIPGGAEPGSAPEGAEQAPPAEPAAPADAAGAADAADRPQSSAMARLQELVEASRHTFEQLQGTIDERIRELVPVGGGAELRTAIEALTRRVEELEQRVAKLSGRDGGPASGPKP
jgi:polyhydroxyalkanoate synthesis repressor PhaR